MIHRTILAALISFAVATLVYAGDKVKVRQGPPVPGAVTQMSPDEVVVEQGPVKKKLPVNEIISIEYDEDPSELLLVRSAYEDGRFADALATVGKIEAAEIKRPEILQDLAFYKAAASARLALGGGASPKEAGKLLVGFESKESGSYHYLEVCELLGDLLVSTGNLDKAQTYYDKLASSSFPDYKLKASVLVGRSLQAQKQHEKAIAKFDEVIASDATGKAAEAQKLSATCGKAVSLAASGKADDAIKLVEEVISKADAGDLELHARAYNALGSCYVSAKKNKEALIAYLHTDLLFSGYPEQHAEALAALSTLWEAADKKDRGQQAKATLKERYPGSRWAQQK
jgi:tetratricopeptide (TPR) repeat protein